MPTYTFECRDCKKVKEVRRPMKESHDPIDCDDCGPSTEMQMIITTPPGFELKGNGWFNKGGY